MRTGTAVAVLLALGFGQTALANGLPAQITEDDYAPVRAEEAALGQLLFYDPILSGNKEVACATCHHPALGTGDGLSLPMGDGGMGLGPDRVVDANNPPEQRVPRNAQPLFNLGAKEFKVLFHDGRIEEDATRPYGLRTPLDEDMLQGFDSLLSAQTMFPVLSNDEMAGHYSESEIATAVRQGRLTGPGGAWDLIARRVAQIPAYADQFRAVYGIEPDQIAFTDISNAIAAFMAFEWRSDTAPFDAYLRGQGDLSDAALRGMELFYGEAGCSACHGGKFQTDHGFHAMGVPQLGPGKGARFETHARDDGRFRVTGHPEDAYAFRTPSLRNVALTGPYGHSGAYATLDGFVVAHLDPLAALEVYDRTQVVLPAMEVADWRVMDDPEAVAAIKAAVTVQPVDLSPDEIAELLAFLESLTDPIAPVGRLGVPATVPSGLTVPNPVK